MIKRWLLGALAVLVAAVVVVNLTVARLPSTPPPRGKFLAVDGRNIHYIEQPGHGTPVLMLHGLPATLHDFDPVLAKLPGAHVFSIDRPGFGWSTGGWAPFQQQIDIVHTFLTQLHIGPAIVVGHSFGGSLALGLARKYPHDVAYLVLLAAAAGGMRSFTQDKVQARYVLFSHLPVIDPIIRWTFGNIALRLSAYFGSRSAFTPEAVPADYTHRLLAVTLKPANAESFAREQLEFDTTAQWLDDNAAQIRVPAVEIAARDDKLVPIAHARRLAETLPGLRLVTVDGNHMIPYTHPDVVAAEITAAGQGR
ncbi:MAG TPA: alpha/beta hydrolase [Mycobacterium sp.]